MGKRDTKKQKSKGRIITGIVGGALGLLSLALPWITFRGSLFGYEIIGKEFTLLEIMDLASDPVPIFLIIVLVLAGSVIAFASAWGGVMQLLSWALLTYGVTSELGREMIFGIHGLVEVSYSFQNGLFLAVIASIITLIGFAFRS